MNPRDTNCTIGLQTPPTIAQSTNQQAGQLSPIGTLPPTLDHGWLQLILGAVIATVTNMQQGNGNLLGITTTGTHTTTTQSAKLINGANKHSLLGFCG